MLPPACLCVLNICPMGGCSHFIRREIHYCIVEWRKHEIQSDFLSETVALDDPNEIWKHYVCVHVCVYAQKARSVHSSLHHSLMDKFPPSSRHALVVTVMTSCFLLLFWRVVGGMWQSYGAAASQRFTALQPPGTHDKHPTFSPFLHLIFGRAS